MPQTSGARQRFGLCVRPTGFSVFAKLYPPFLPQEANAGLQLLFFLCICTQIAIQELKRHHCTIKLIK